MFYRDNVFGFFQGVCIGYAQMNVASSEEKFFNLNFVPHIPFSMQPFTSFMYI